MANPVVAHVFVACSYAECVGPVAAYSHRNLNGVCYVYRTSPPGAFPYQADIHLFVRLALQSKRQAVRRQIYVSLVWHDNPAGRSEGAAREFHDLEFRQAVPVRDISASVDCVFNGAGRYEFQLWYDVVAKWSGAKGRRIVARTYFRIEG